MYQDQLRHLYPTLEMLCEELTLAGITCRRIPGRGNRFLRGIMPYRGDATRQDILYIVPGAQASGFPGNRCSGICSIPLSGDAGHILCPDMHEDSILPLILELFLRYRSMEAEIDALVYSGGSPDDLCTLGKEFLGNPVCIHDDWFIITAMSQDFSRVMPPDYLASSNRAYIPRRIVEDFIQNEEYAQTHNHRAAQLWQSTPNAPKSLYVNLWDGDLYLGRLLVVQCYRSFRLSDYMIAECLTQRAIQLLRRQQISSGGIVRSMDDVVCNLLDGGLPDSAEEQYLLNMLGWKKNDKLTVIRIQAKQSIGNSVTDHVLHSDLFHVFPGSYILLRGDQQCVITNISQTGLTLSRIQACLLPLCRDYCLYAGISSPAFGIRSLSISYQQAQIALNHIFRLRSAQWSMPFSECALDHILLSLDSPIPTLHLASPELMLLLDHDRENGTQYFETLRTYLLMERDIPRTSEALIIHRTTLLYRLKKIQALTELNLEDPQQRLYLLLSLQILKQQMQ